MFQWHMLICAGCCCLLCATVVVLAHTVYCTLIIVTVLLIWRYQRWLTFKYFLYPNSSTLQKCVELYFQIFHRNTTRICNITICWVVRGRTKCTCLKEATFVLLLINWGLIIKMFFQKKILERKLFQSVWRNGARMKNRLKLWWAATVW